MFLKMCPRDAPSLLEISLVEMLRSIHASRIDAARLRNAASLGAPSNSAPLVPDPSLDRPRVIVSYLSILALLLSQTPALFNTFLSGGLAFQATGSTSSAVLWSMLVDEWIDKFDDIGGGATGPWVRKLWVMALCVPVSSGDGVAMSRFGEIANLCVYSLSDDTTQSPMFMPSPDRASGASGAGGAGGGNGSVGMSLEAAARQKQQSTDPVHCTPLSTTIQGSLQRCQAAVGQGTFQQAIGATDPSTMSQLQVFLR
jgi:hypothetical protein